ncbi:hypothetical protein PRUPE_4G282900 [Prunus persica]|uniref:Uncharacterized protein n=1 Tax=Prunus persica TaxID=3760 RepID=M5WIP9_PRUPE|nr:hypothetical protein PRUPE_4G282900 [Prunus persica]
MAQAMMPLRCVFGHPLDACCGRQRQELLIQSLRKSRGVPITEKDSMIHKYGVTQENCFAHLDLSFKFYALSGEVNGVLGQTYASNYVSKIKMGVVMPVLGGDKEFASSSIFASDCAVSRLSGEFVKNNSSDSFEYMNCASGTDGRGVVL